MLTPAEARILLLRYHRDGDGRAREQLIEGWLPQVRKLAFRFGGRGESLEDLVQVGMVGLIKAVDRFDLDRGVEFSTYAVPNVIGEIKRHFRDRAWAVRVPRELQELAVRAPRERERLAMRLAREPSLAELAEALAVEEELLLEALTAKSAYKALSFSAAAPASEDDETEGNLLERLGDDDPGYERCEHRLTLRTGIACLDDRERRVLLLRFAREQTQSQIAAQLGYSQMHICRIIRRALEKLQAAVLDENAAAA